MLFKTVSVCCFLILPAVCQRNNFTKPFTLTVLTFVPKTGWEPTVGATCEASFREVVRKVNSRIDFLPNYHLNLVVYDEGKSQFLLPRNAANFLSTYGDDNENFKIAPVTFGPAGICYLASLMLKVNYFMMFSQNCNSQTFSDEHYSNVFSVKSPAFDKYYGFFALFNNSMTWRRYGLVTSMDVVGDYGNAAQIHQTFASKGFEFGTFQAIYASEINSDVMLAMKAKARVIVMISSSVSFCLKYLCKAYESGMRPPNFVFVSMSLCYANGAIIRLTGPMHCPLHQLEEMFKGYYFLGSHNFGLQETGLTTSGFTMAEFDRSVAIAAAKISPTLWQMDFGQRHLCHDVATFALTTLNMTENYLQRRNRSLLEFRRKPKEIYAALEYSVRHVEFKGFREHLYYVSLSRGRFDAETIWFSQPDINGSLTVYYSLKPRTQPNGDSEDPTDPKSYEINKIREPKWGTKSGQPPKDLSQIQHRNNDFPVVVFWILSVSCSIAAFLSIAAACVILWKRQTWLSTATTQQTEPCHFDVGNNLLILMGSFILALADIVMLIGTRWLGSDICRFRNAPIAIGLSMITATLCYRMFSMANLWNLYHEEKFRWLLMLPVVRVQGRHFTKKTRRTILNAILRHTEAVLEKVRVGILTFVSINALITVIWLGLVDEMNMKVETTPVLFDEDADSYFDVSTEFCHSKYETYWVSGIGALQMFMLIIANYLALEYKSTMVPSAFRVEFAVIKLAVINAFGLFVVVAVALLLISTSHFKIIVFTCGSLTYIFSINITVLFPMWSGKWQGEVMSNTLS